MSTAASWYYRRYLYVLEGNIIQAISLQDGSVAPAAAATLSSQPGGPNAPNGPNLLTGDGRFLYAGAAVCLIWRLTHLMHNLSSGAQQLSRPRRGASPYI